MPKYTPSDDEMDESTYGGSSAAAPVEKPGEENTSVDEENAGAPEILVEKAKLGDGVKPGDECTFRVVKDFGDEVSLEYVKEGEGETAPETTTPAEDFAAMDTEKA